ncbi:hypothetical protein [Klebsiella pneumoniae]
MIAAIYRHETGVSVIDDWDGFGQKTTGSGTLKVHQVHLPASHLIPFDQRFKYQTAFYQVVHLATLGPDSPAWATGSSRLAIRSPRHSCSCCSGWAATR